MPSIGDELIVLALEKFTMLQIKIVALIGRKLFMGGQFLYHHKQVARRDRICKIVIGLGGMRLGILRKKIGKQRAKSLLILLTRPSMV